MKYRSVTVRPLITEGDIGGFTRALKRCEEVPVRLSASAKKCEISATLRVNADMARVQKCLKAVGLQVVEDVEVES